MNLLNDQNNRYFKQSKLVVVETNDDQWLLIQQAIHLCLSDLVVTRFTSIDQAVIALNEWQHQEWELPQIILLNLHSPDKLRGWQLLEQLKKMPSPICSIPVIIFSSSVRRIDVTRSYQSGAAAYIIKPSDLSGWADCLLKLRTYWWETVALPPLQYVS